MASKLPLLKQNSPPMFVIIQFCREKGEMMPPDNVRLIEQPTCLKEVSAFVWS